MDRGVYVMGTSRSHPGSGPWHVFCPADLSQAESSIPGDWRFWKPIDAIIHCAGLAHRPHEDAQTQAGMFSANALGTQRLLAWAHELGIPRIVYAGSIAAYDWTTGERPDEDGALRFTSSYAESKHAGELAVRESGLDWRIARLATVFGRGDKANFARLAHAIKHRRMVIPGNGCARKSVLPLPLAARVLGSLSLCAEPEYRVFNVALHEAPSLLEIATVFSEHCGFPQAPRFPVSGLRGAALAADFLAWMTRRKLPLSLEVIRKLTTSTAVRVERLESCFPGIGLSISFADSLKSSCDYYRDLP